MAKLKIFLGLLSMLHSAAKELGIDNLTKSDEQVLFILWELSKNGKQELSVTYDEFTKTSNDLNITISRAQFYKSLKILEAEEVISRVGSDRSKTYKILTSS